MTRMNATTWQGATLIALACALAVVPAGPAQARLGDLDPSFDGDGIANVSAPGRFEAVAARPGGGAVPDTEFGGGGVSLPPVSHAFGTALDATQRILVAGSQQTPSGELPRAWRIAPDGKVEGPFVISSLPGQAHAIMSLGSDILVAGWRLGPEQHDVFFVARLEDNGRPDSSFGGGDGVAEADFGVPAQAFAMAVDAAGRRPCRRRPWPASMPKAIPTAASAR